MAKKEETSGAQDPHEAFLLFSHELRLEILLELKEAADYSLKFAELQSRVGVRDSGQFTYHLSKLEGLFIEKVGDRYILKHSGHRVIDAMRSGVFHESPSIGPVEVEGACPDCGGVPLFTYEDHLGTISCSECEKKLVEYPIDPGAFHGQSVEEGIVSFDRWTKDTWRMASDNVCFACAGQVTASFTETAEGPEYLDRYDDFFAADHPVVIELRCRNCSFYSYVPAGVRILDNPSVVGNLAERGIDVHDRWIWELPFIIDGQYVEVLSSDPWEVRVEAPTESGVIEVVLDDDVSIATVTERLQ